MENMKLTRHIHACVRIEEGATTLIVDPGTFGVPPDLAAADAVLLTHGHPDHVDVAELAAAREQNPQLAVYAPASVAETVAAARVVAAGDRLRIGEIEVEVVGTEHAAVLRCQPTAENVGYLFNATLLHPGDAFQEVALIDTALVPVNGPWVKMLDVEAWLDRQRPRRFAAIHDGIVNDFGLAINDKQLRILAENYGAEYVPLSPGQSLDL